MTRHRTFALTLPLLAVLVGALAAFTLLAVGSAQAPLGGMVFYEAGLTGDQVVPAVATPATGTFTAEGEEGGNEIRFRLSGQIAGITQAHIHLGPPGENGPVAAFLFGPADPAVDEVAVDGTLTVNDLVGPVAADWDAFIAGLFVGAYVQIHTAANPPGALRGQIFVALPAPLAPEPTVGGELPPDPDRPPPVEAAGPDTPDGLPTTGSGGLADAPLRGASATPWLLALVGIAAAFVITGVTVRRWGH